MDDFEELISLFDPHALGTSIVRGNYRVRINAESQTIALAKCYMVDTVIEAIWHPPRPIELTIYRQSIQRPSSAKVACSRDIENLKHPFKSSRL